MNYTESEIDSDIETQWIIDRLVLIKLKNDGQ